MIFGAMVLLGSVLGLFAGGLAAGRLTPKRAKAFRLLAAALVGITFLPALLGWEEVLDFVSCPGAAFCAVAGFVMLFRGTDRAVGGWLIAGALFTLILVGTDTSAHRCRG